MAWGLGAITLKLSGHYLPLCTIAWGLSLYFLFGNLEFLGGHTGIAGVPALAVAGVSLASPRALGLVIWAVLLLALWALHNLLDSREGRAIRALKGGRVMAESMGVDTGALPHQGVRAGGAAGGACRAGSTRTCSASSTRRPSTSTSASSTCSWRWSAARATCGARCWARR